eukprot:TRINITY_DN40398_c0_g1_i1.p1 TRINITY_DN40398_c0_g1~~TRINITY_DN40398_c0_g1_i1.p1  ORF type:complete len:272 (-),score=33.80 TRINITY_DN40398_c0_g1_i1:213-1004(-)
MTSLGLDFGYGFAGRKFTAQKRLVSSLRHAWKKEGAIDWPKLVAVLDELQLTTAKRTRYDELDVCVSSDSSWDWADVFNCPICQADFFPRLASNAVTVSHLVNSAEGLQFWRDQVPEEAKPAFEKVLQECPTFTGPDHLLHTALMSPQLAILTCAGCSGLLLNKVSFWQEGETWLTAHVNKPPHPVPAWLARQFSLTPRMPAILNDHRRVIQHFELAHLQIRGAGDTTDDSSNFDWEDALCPEVESRLGCMQAAEKIQAWKVE